MNVSRLEKAGVAPHGKVDSLLTDHESEKLVRTGRFVIVSPSALSRAPIVSRVAPSLAKHLTFFAPIVVRLHGGPNE